MALWGFGRGHARLNPAPAGWHRGEREVTAPQHTAHKTLRVAGESRERERIGLWYTLPQDGQAVGVTGSHLRFKQTHPNIQPISKQAPKKAIG